MKALEQSNDCLLNQVSETIFTALHTRSGWYCLHRESEAVFLQVDPTQASGTRWLTVRVSDIYKPDSEVSIIDGLRALFQSCKVAEDTKLKQFGDIGTRLMLTNAQRYGRSTQRTEMNKGNEGHAADKLVDLLALTSSERTILQRAIREKTLLNLSRGDLARFFLVNASGDLGCGSSGYVVRSCVDGVDFAVKRWNRYEWDVHNAGDGLFDLRYEMQVYAYLQKYYPDVLGRIVPIPIAIWDNTDTEYATEEALVMTMVGEDIQRKYLDGEGDCESEVWTVNGEEVSEEDVNETKKGAQENLEELEGLRVEDYDVRVLNIRVDRVKNERGRSKWHAWTIDLGRCCVFRNGKQLSLESLRSLVSETPQ